ncbi:sigma-70 family RNA polymerase sigma factor [Aureisphaera galaxeae]|uniref:RNA polymerase sigma factor n=1 Tax=Aureisphaera galaxeae TaxID=1538023 RepID=UPI002350BDE1|nr:sigma-70 family RNA polymerase sigma factor [Aureisphaera galaxeae]MDC8003372.1 sigma-70 family RNA polymerase sigma factor [Aureisphaera galaxeae]
MKGSKAERDFALRAVYKGNKEKVCSFVLRNQGSESDAKDIFQEAMIAFYENVRDGKFKGESAIGTYLYSIAKFKWLNQIKKDKIREGHHEKAAMETVQESPLNTLIEGEKKHGVLQVLDELGAVCKQLLIENLYHNASMKEIAASGNFSSEQIVRNKKYKCLQKLKELIRMKPSLIPILKGYG